MALAFQKISDSNDRIPGGLRRVYAKITFDSSYPTGGEAVTASDFGLTELVTVEVHGAARKSDATDAVFCSFDHTNSKIVCYRQKDPAAAGGADIALPEVGNTANLSSYSLHVCAVGR